jgi:hypothetical protein
MNLILLGLLAVTQAQPREVPPGTRQFYAEWTHHKAENQWVRWYSYKPSAKDTVFRRKAVYFLPDRSEGLYFVDARTGVVDGRMNWDLEYLQLDPAAKFKRIREIDERSFEAPRSGKTIFGSDDGLLIETSSPPPGYLRIEALAGHPSFVVEVPENYSIKNHSSMPVIPRGIDRE